MKSAAIFTATFCLALALAAHPAQGADSATMLLVRQAHSLEVKGRLDLASQNWRRVLLAEPDNADALAGLARIAKTNGDLPEAERQLNRLRVVQPNHPSIRRIEALKVLASQKSELDRAVRLASEQQYEGAMEIYRSIFGPEPVPGSWAIAYYETAAALPGGWDTAVAGLRKLVAEFQGVQDYQLSLGRVLSYRPATRAEGLQLLEGVNGDEALANRARQAWRQALIWQGPASSSVPSFSAYLERYPDAEIETLRSQAKSAQAPATVAGRREEELGFEALKANRLAEAEELFQKAQRLAPGNAGPLGGLGFVRMKQDRFADAIPFFEEALARRTNDKVIQEAVESARFYNWMNKADASFQGGFYEEASSFYDKAWEARSDSSDALRGKAGSLMRLDRFAEAADAYERLTQIDSRDTAAWKSLLRARYQSGGSPLAWTAYQRMPEAIRVQLGSDLDHLIVMASIHSDLKRKAEFDRTFRQAMEVAGAADTRPSLDQRMELGALLLKVGRFAEAATEFEAVVTMQPENAHAWDGLLAALAQSGNDVRSLAVLGRMPDQTYQEALQRPGFLLSASSIYRSADKLMFCVQMS
jgi:tetratricopeptide (TPR) repeat protein